MKRILVPPYGNRIGARGSLLAFPVLPLSDERDPAVSTGRISFFQWSAANAAGICRFSARDPREEMVTILLTQRMMESPFPPPVFQDFWTLAWQAIDD